MRQACLAWALASTLATTASLAQQLSGPELSWEAPAGCPQLRQVRARIDAIAGSTVKRTGQLQAEAYVTRADGRYHLKLIVREGALTGERNISSDSCEDLAGATAVALGLMLRTDAPLTESALRGADMPATSGDAPPATQTKPSAQAQPEAYDDPGSPAASESARSGHWRAILRAPSLVAALGLLPKPSFGAALGAGFRYDDWRVLLTGQLWLNQTMAGADLPAYGAVVAHQTLLLTVGHGFRSGRLELAPSLTLALQHISARGVGPGVEPSEQQAVWLGAGAGLQGAVEVGRALALFAELGGRLETSRPLLSIAGLGDVRQLGPVALDVAGGVEWTF